MWDKAKCTHCGACLPACNHKANRFSGPGPRGIPGGLPLLHAVPALGLKVCPAGAIKLDSHDYADFPDGHGHSTKAVLDTFEPGNAFYFNVLTQITALCDCWGMTTTPALVPTSAS